VLRSSHKVLTLRLGVQGYSISQGKETPRQWLRWPAEVVSIDGVQAQLAKLELPHIQGHTLLDVVFDTALTRMQIVRFPNGLRKTAERTAYLKACFRNVFGQDANNWHIVAETAYMNEPVPAVAIEPNLLQAVTAFGERHKLKLRSMRTSFVDLFNSVQRKLSAYTGAIALIENGRVCLGFWRKRSWVSVSAQAIANDDANALADLHAQMLARIDPPMPAGTLYVAGTPSARPLPLREGWAAQWIASGAQ